MTQPRLAETAVKQNSASPDAPDSELQEALRQIARLLNGLRFGQVTVIVQDGKVVQIDRLERTRL
jgi:hypothetical protein